MSHSGYLQKIGFFLHTVQICVARNVVVIFLWDSGAGDSDFARCKAKRNKGASPRSLLLGLAPSFLAAREIRIAHSMIPKNNNNCSQCTCDVAGNVNFKTLLRTCITSV